jgi:hypothetical protein
LVRFWINRGKKIDDQLKDAPPQVWLPYFKDDTPIILDLSDIAKPLARKIIVPKIMGIKPLKFSCFLTKRV